LVREFPEIAFDKAGLSIDELLELDSDVLRPAEVEHLIGDATKAKQVLGWEPEVSFEELIRMMVDADHAFLKHGLDGSGVRTR
jgi:GDPmannose 4,6-dehydratase